MGEHYKNNLALLGEYNKLWKQQEVQLRTLELYKGGEKLSKTKTLRILNTYGTVKTLVKFRKDIEIRGIEVVVHTDKENRELDKVVNIHFTEDNEIVIEEI